MKITFFLFLLTITFFLNGQDLKWFKTFSDSDGIYFGDLRYHAKLDTAGNLIIGGQNSSGGVSITKIDSIGNLMWRKTFPTATDLGDFEI